MKTLADSRSEVDQDLFLWNPSRTVIKNESDWDNQTVLEDAKLAGVNRQGRNNSNYNVIFVYF